MYFSATIAGVVPFLSTVHQLHASPENRSDVRNKRRSLYGGSIQATKGKTKHGYGGIVPIFPSFRLSSSRASCNATKVLVSEARFRPATPNHRYILVYPIDSIVPQIIRIMEKSTRQILQRFDLLLRTIQRSLDNFPTFSSLRLTNFSVGSIVLFNKTRRRNYRNFHELLIQ